MCLWVEKTRQRMETRLGSWKQNTVWWYGDVFVLMESELNAQKYIHLTFWTLISGLSLPITFRHEINFFSGWQCSIHRARVVQEFITHKKLHNRYEWTSRLQIFGCTLIKVSQLVTFLVHCAHDHYF